MEFNRNQFFMLGLVVLFLGIQFRAVETFVLNEKASRILAEKFHPAGGDSSAGVRPFLAAVGPTPHQTVRPPDWLGWSLVSVGSVLILHSLAMKRPGA